MLRSAESIAALRARDRMGCGKPTEPDCTWRRFGQWAAHLFVDGKQACSTKHGGFPWAEAQRAKMREEPERVPLSLSGLPFGRICQPCLKRWHRLRASKG